MRNAVSTYTSKNTGHNVYTENFPIFFEYYSLDNTISNSPSAVDDVDVILDKKKVHFKSHVCTVLLSCFGVLGIFTHLSFMFFNPWVFLFVLYGSLIFPKLDFI